MKHFFLLAVAATLLAASCSSDTGSKAQTDSTRVSPDVPHAIIGGGKTKVGSWAYPLDTAMNLLVLGYNEGVRELLRSFDNAKFELAENRGTMRLLNNQDTELLTVLICKNSKDEWVPYQFRLEKYNTKGTYPGKPPVRQYDQHWFSANQAHMGYTEAYFLKLMSEQPLMTWAKGDTVYYTHQAQPKDAKRLNLYTPADFSSTYKFIDGNLCWMEVCVKPEAFEKK